MQQKSFLALSLVLAGLGSASHAELVGGEVRLSYGAIDVGELENNFTDFVASAAFDYQFARNFGVQAGAAYQSLGYSESGIDLSASVTSFDLHAYYQIETFRVGAFVGSGNLGEVDIEGFTFDLDQGFSTYGLEAQINSGNLTVGGLYGVLEVDGIGEIDTTIYGFNGAYALNDAFSINAAYDASKLSVDGFDESVTISNLRIGADYNLGGMINAPVVISGYVGRLGVSDGEFDETATTYGGAVSYLFGADTSNQRRRLFQSYFSPL